MFTFVQTDAGVASAGFAGVNQASQSLTCKVPIPGSKTYVLLPSWRSVVSSCRTMTDEVMACLFLRWLDRMPQRAIGDSKPSILLKLTIVQGTMLPVLR
jgi:hypothetical protein